MGIRGLVHSSRTRLFLILVVGLILRVGYARSLGPEPRFGDAADYLVCSDNLVHGAGFRLEPVTTKRGHLGPVYPLFLAGLRLAGVDRVEMFRLVQAIIGSCLPLLLFFLGRRLFDTVTALWAALFAALYPYMIHWSGTISSEWIGILLLVLGLWMLTAAESRPGPVLFLAAGGAIGLAALARPPLYPLCLLFTGLVLIGN